MSLAKSRFHSDSELKPSEIVKKLDEYIVGQAAAKKAVAVAVRNRFRRRMVSEDLKDEIYPKNILMVGPTGVGKTEISRRLAKLVDSPFIKVEATKFTEVGYVGRDVEGIIRDLADIAVNNNREKHRELVQKEARVRAEDRILNVMVGEKGSEDTRQKFREKIRSGAFDHTEIEIEVEESKNNAGALPGMMSQFELPGAGAMGSVGMFSLGDLFDKMSGAEKRELKLLSVEKALEIISAEEAEKLIDKDAVIKDALNNAQQNGIVFIDEIDKIISGDKTAARGEVSREGVQRDLLPLVEGTTVNTKYGPIKTDHILFIASGAFYVSKVSGLLPELQGRFPIRVEMTALSESDLLSILTKTKANLIEQHQALLAVDDVQLEFTKDALDEIVHIVAKMNQEVENIGARRLNTVIEKLLEEVSFNAPDLKEGDRKVVIDKAYISEKLAGLISKSARDLKNFIL